MELGEYLQALKDCPEGFIPGTRWSHLKLKCGIEDNWPILLNGDFTKVNELLIGSGKFERSSIPRYVEATEEGILHFLEYTPGTVVLKFYNQDTTEYGAILVKEEAHRKKILGKYNLGMSVQCWNPREIKGYEDMADTGRPSAMAIIDVGNIIIENNIPACFPWTRQYTYIPGEGVKLTGRHSEIVYHP